MTSHPYTFEEFLEHHTKTREILGGYDADTNDRSFEANAARVFTYMLRQYPNEDEARDKARLFMLIETFLAENAEKFDVGKLAVVGEEQGLISVHLLRAAHHALTSKPLSQLGRGPTVSEIISLAEQYELEESE